MELSLAKWVLEGSTAAVLVLGGLADTVAKATVVLACAGVVAWLARRSSASARHLAWALAVLATLTLPVLSATLPALKVELLPAPSAQGSVEAAAAGAAPSDPAGLPGWLTAEVVLPLWVLALWVSVAGVLLSKLAFDRLLLAELAARARPVVDGRAALARQLAGRLGVGRKVRLLESDEVRVPMTWGALAPTLLVPSASRGWPAEQLELALLHELSHIRRGDAFTQLLAQLASALFWFHPLVWLAGSKLRQLREYACDDLVLRSGALPSRYAEALLAMVREAAEGRGAVAGTLAMASRSQLYQRMVAVLDASRARRSALHPAWAGAAAVLVVLPLAALTPTTTAPPGPAVAEAGAAPSCEAALAEAPQVACSKASARSPSAVRSHIAAQVAGASSDRALAAALVEVARAERLDDEPTRQAFIQGARAVRDELLRAQVLRALLVEAPISEQTGRAVLEVAGQARRDAGRAPVLQQFHALRERDLVRGPLAEEYQRTAEGLRSPGELAQVLKAQLHPTAVPKPVVLRALALLQRVDTAQQVLEVLEEVTDHQVMDAEVERAYRAAVERLPDEARGESFVKLASARHRAAKDDTCAKARPGG